MDPGAADLGPITFGSVVLAEFGVIGGVLLCSGPLIFHLRHTENRKWGSAVRLDRASMAQ
jgi:hypothetical protein